MHVTLVALFLATVLTPTRQEDYVTKSVPATAAQLKEARGISLDWQNIFRAWHQSPPLELDDQLNKEAQEYAETLASLDEPKPKHSEANDRNKNHGGKYVGENMAWFRLGKDAPKKNPFNFNTDTEKAAKLWYAGEYCDPEKYPRDKFDHWTQVLWKDTKKVGIGMAYSFKMKNRYLNLYIVARYSPAGNIGGDCTDGKNVSFYNILPLRCNEGGFCPAPGEAMDKFSKDWNFKVGFLMDTIKKDDKKKCPPKKNRPEPVPTPEDCGEGEPENPDVAEEDIKEEGDIEGIEAFCDFGIFSKCASTNLKPIGFGSSILLVILLALIF